MPKHLSEELRKLIVSWRHDQNKTVQEIANLANCSERTVYTILSYNRDYGVVSNPKARPRGRRRTLETTDVEYVLSLLDANPALYLDEIQERLLEVRDVEISMATLCRTMRRAAMSRKKLAKHAMERNELLRATWLAVHGSIPAEYFIWMDESSVDRIVHQRDHGWSTVGLACVRRATFIRGQRFSILPALTTDGIIALDIFEGSVDKEKFILFVRERIAPQLNPYPGPRSVVVLDNCAIHHDEEVRQIVEVDCGGKLIFLPPYSPDFNPIEQAFHSMKAWLRRHESEALRPEMRTALIEQALQAISPQDAAGWILNCGYE